MAASEKHKRIKHFHEPGDLHELTFSCFRRMPLLTNDPWRYMLARSIDAAMIECQFQLVAFVFMPEHVHLLVNPLQPKPDLAAFLTAIKRPYSSQIRQLLEAGSAPLLKTLTVRERPGKEVFRYWQEGPGFDRNLYMRKAILAAIDYLHNNPVKRQLVQQAVDWKWSSARCHLFPDAPRDCNLPMIHGLPADFWNDQAGRDY